LLNRFSHIAVLVCLVAISCSEKQPDNYNPYTIVSCAEVLEFVPAPGQFIGDGYVASTMEEACEYAYGRLTEGQYVSLGAFGGYIVAEFEHELLVEPTIVVVGNSTQSSSEPGIIYYMYDSNRNGLPDDEWIEVQGSLHGTDEEQHDYSVTYYKPSGAGQDVKWTDNQGAEGYVYRNEYHSQESYYPDWIGEDSYMLSGVHLKSRAYDQSGKGTMWVSPSYGSGYADNYSTEYTEFKNAVNNEFGETVLSQTANIFHVKGPVSFVKIQSAVLDSCGWIGEVSTEVCGIFGIESFYLE